MEPEPICEVCGLACDLDDPDTELAPAVICGDCFRAREFDEVMLWDEGGG